MEYDVIIIGAGMSGLAAGIRLAYFGKKVCVLERHYAYGGLNSYYTLEGREFDVGLHAVTNFAPPGTRGSPLGKLLRQLRLSRDDFDLHEQKHSEIRFPGRTLRFSNSLGQLIDEVAREFPKEADRFVRFLQQIRDYDSDRLDVLRTSARPILRDALRDPILTDMLLCPVMYYGSAEEHDMDFTQFVTLFKSIFLEGLARPRHGVRTIIKALVRKYREHGGDIRMRCGVVAINNDGHRAGGVSLDSGEILTGSVILSSAGYAETISLAKRGLRSGEGGDPKDPDQGKIQAGQISFVESIAVLDRTPLQWGHDATVVFYNDGESFEYARPRNPVDLASGIVCCPNNYQGHDDMEEGIFRLTWLANHETWMQGSADEYAAAKRSCHDAFLAVGERFLPGFSQHVVFADMFTPRTIHYYTGHVNGAVYGSPLKHRDGRTPLENVFVCGTDQGYLGIIGAMLGGITVANTHVLSHE